MALLLVIGDLDNEVRPYGEPLPRHVRCPPPRCALEPAERPAFEPETVFPGMARQLVHQVRRKSAWKLASLGRRQLCEHANVVKQSVVVVQAEQQ